MQAAIAPARRGQQPDTSACDVSSACKTWVTFKGDLDVRAKSGKSGQPVARVLDVAAPNLVTSLCCCPPRWCWSAGCMRALPAGGAHACRSRRRCYQRLVVVDQYQAIGARSVRRSPGPKWKHALWRVPGPQPTSSTQTRSLCAPASLEDPCLKSDHIGRYRTSIVTQCKLRRVMGEIVAPRRRSPITRADSGDGLMSACVADPALAVMGGLAASFPLPGRVGECGPYQAGLRASSPSGGGSLYPTLSRTRAPRRYPFSSMRLKPSASETRSIRLNAKHT